MNLALKKINESSQISDFANADKAKHSLNINLLELFGDHYNTSVTQQKQEYKLCNNLNKEITSNIIIYHVIIMVYHGVKDDDPFNLTD